MIPRRKATLYKNWIFDLLRLILSNKVLSGEHIGIFQKKFADYHGKKFACNTPSGREGFRWILESLDLKKGSEVIIPAYSYKAIPEIIRQAGLTPVFVDSVKGSFSVSVSEVTALISPRTSLIIAVHLFGASCRADKLKEIAAENNIFLIEDCAQSIGSYIDKDIKTGTCGIAAFFSFDVTKTINTMGGGMIITDDHDIAEYIKNRSRGLKKSYIQLCKKIINYTAEYFCTRWPFNVFVLPLARKPFTASILKKVYRMLRKNIAASPYAYTNFQALLGLRQIDITDSILIKRIKIAERYSDLLGLDEYNGHLPARPLAPENIKREVLSNTYYNYIVLVSDPSKLGSKMIKNSMDCGITDEILSNCDDPKSSVNAEYFMRHSLELPMSYDLKDDTIVHIADTFKALLL